MLANKITFAQVTDSTHITFVTSSAYDSGLEVLFTDDSGNPLSVTEVNSSTATGYTVTCGTNLDLTKTYTVTVGDMSKTATIAPTLIDHLYAYNGELGAIYHPDSTVFKLWAPEASAVNLLIYNTASDSPPSITYAMTRGTGTEKGVWSYRYLGDADGKIYQYQVTNGGITNKVLDPYAKSMVAFDSEGADTVGKGVVINLNNKAALTLTDPREYQGLKKYHWESDHFYHLQQQTQAIIYEMSVRDFTIDPADDSVPLAQKGTYLGFIYKIPYLKKLGITHVQLMPVVEWYCGKESQREFEDFDRNQSGAVTYPLDGKSSYGKSYYNWGYDPLNFFTPEGWFASDPNNPYARIKELRTLIAALHTNGIGVILDVVYNHTYTTSIFENIVPYYYYRRDANGNLVSYSGCGNDCATERSMFRKLMIDSTTYWLREFHVDGFRFDLAGLFDKETVNRLTLACRAINPSVELHGELWNMGGISDITERYVKGDSSGNSSYRVLMEVKNGVSGFSDGFRDGMIQRYCASPITEGGFIQAQPKHVSSDWGSAIDTDDPYNEKRVRTGIIGNLSNYTGTSGSPLASDDYNLYCDEPGESVNYTNCHDGYTIWDKICGSTPNYSDAERLRVNKLQAAMVLTSQGKVFLHGGEELLRSKPNPISSTSYDSNSYDSPDSVNQICWANSTSPAGSDMIDYYSGMIALRKSHPAFTMENAELIQNSLTFIDGTPIFVIAYRIRRTDGIEPWRDIIVIFNSNRVSQTVNISEVDVTDWIVVVDGAKANLNGFASSDGVYLGNGTITVPAISAVVIHAPNDPCRPHSRNH